MFIIGKYRLSRSPFIEPKTFIGETLWMSKFLRTSDKTWTELKKSGV